MHMYTYIYTSYRLEAMSRPPSRRAAPFLYDTPSPPTKSFPTKSP